MKPILSLLVCVAVLAAQYLPSGGIRRIGGGNNVSVVSGHVGGTGGGSSATSVYNMGGATMTAGNTIFCGVFVNVYPGPFTAAQMTKTAGTATIGTVALDGSIPNTSYTSLAFYRIPVTGTGTLTLTYNPGSSYYQLIGCGEFTGVNSSPVSTTAGNASNTSGALHSTGSVSSTDLGVMIYLAMENPATNFTRSWSDVIIFHIDTGSSTATGIIQYKIINASPNTMQDCTGATPVLPGGACNTGGFSGAWTCMWQLYKSS